MTAPDVMAGELAAPPAAGRRLSFEHVLMNLGFVVLAISICWGVLSRYVLDTPSVWVEEVSSIAFAWTTFIGAAEIQRRNKHVSVDLFTALLPLGLRRPLAVATGLFVALFCFYVAWLGALQTIASNSAYTSMLRIPLSVPYAGLTFGFLLMGVRSVHRLFRQGWRAGL